MPGMFIEFLDILSNRLNLTLEFISYGNGDEVYNELLDHSLPNGSVDLITQFLVQPKSLSDAYDLTLPVYFVRFLYGEF